MQEIERKFIVDTSKWQPKTVGKTIVQGFLSNDKERVVRVRIMEDQAFISVKGENDGIVRTEFEYAIPLSDAHVLLKMCLDHPVEKTRYFEQHFNKQWEIDVFQGVNQGLVMAEVELDHKEESITLPEWVKEEVSLDKRFYNACLSQHPFSKW